MKDQRQDDEEALRARLAALPREVAPPPHLWRDIESRILARRALARARTRHAVRASLLFAAAASAAAAIGLASRGVSRDVGVARRDALSAPVSSIARAADGESSGDASVLAEEPSYRAAIAALRASFAERKGALPPESGAAVDESLRVLDAAIADARAALAEMPEDDDLRAELGDAYQHEIDVLDDVLDLPWRS